MLVRGAGLQTPAGGGGAATADSSATARAFLRAHRDLLRLDDPDAELHERRRAADALGRSHVWFEQIYRGLPVWPAQLAVHLDGAGRVDVMDGAYVPTPRSLSVEPTVARETAVDVARREVTNGRAAQPDTDLIIYAPGDRAPRLAWRVELSATLAERWLVIVDADDGALLASIDLVEEANVRGSGRGVFNDQLPIDVFEENGAFFLVDTSKPMFDPSSDPPSPETTRGAIIILDAANGMPDFSGRLDLAQVVSSNSTSWLNADGVSASFGLSQTYDYYLERHSRDSLDGQGGTMLGIVRFGLGFQNAFWNGTAMVFGDGQPFAGAIDVVAHELTHGVTQFSANLVYLNQSGALNEAFSDIFGEMVEARTRGTPDFVKGADLGQPFQNYADPGSLEIFPGAGRGSPSRLSELLRPDDPFLNNFQGRDNGGVHINSAIINHAYYLLAEGLAGSIGLRDAERIFYRTLTVHLVANSQFIDARIGALTSAAELFGADSAQARKTAEAFDAVEIFDDVTKPPPTPIPPVASPDSALFVFFESEDTAQLGRREDALQDDPEGVQLSTDPVALARPSISGDGSIAAFVDATNDVCLVSTDGSSDVECLGFSGFVSSVAMAPDGTRFAFVLLDDFGVPQNAITIVDVASGTNRMFELASPGQDGGGLNSVLFADSMDFTVDGNGLIYDAFSTVQLVDGSISGAWSIFALDIDAGTTQVLVPAIAGFDISFPSLGQTSETFITFDAIDQQTGISAVVAGNLLTGDLQEIAEVQGPGTPGYTGDDGAIVFTREDSQAASGFSLFRQRVAADRITPVGDPSLWLRDGFLSAIYRRGEFTPPRLDGECTGDCSANGVVTVNELVTGVNLALGRVPLASCQTFDRDGDGKVAIDELIVAVADAIHGC
jgi:Zn-dependent metalloprotease